jgi:transcriptional regulator with GAF, ATPase, and Fis domain
LNDDQQRYLQAVLEKLEQARQALSAAAYAELADRLHEQLLSGLIGAQEPETAIAASELPGRFGILGESAAMQEVFALLERIVKSEFPVLVTGESGSGKELVARAIHDYGPRRKRTFLSENCAAIPDTLLESILFGHVKGSFTGAHRDNPGHFVTADRGTLFLDELGDMPLLMQGKLLRVIQDGEVRPVGGDKVKKVDVRLVAATNKDLRRLVEEGAFRQDLYYRLNVLEIRLPPLRERGDDILIIAEHLLRRARKELGRPGLGLDDAAAARLQEHAWPGNVRELENEIRRASALSTGDRIGADELSVGG